MVWNVPFNFLDVLSLTASTVMTKMNVPNAKKDISDIIIGQDLQVTVSSNRPKMINLSRIAKYLMHRFLMF